MVETLVPEDVRRSLEIAYTADHVGEVECTEGHVVEERRYLSTEAGEFDMLYGELLPESVSKALVRLEATKSGTILELGMGTGKVAFQVFLQCSNAHRVIGVEISPGRYEVAAAAACRLAEACPDKFSYRDANASDIAQLLNDPGVVGSECRCRVLEETATGRCLWLLENDLAVVACVGGPVQDAQAIFMQLRLPKEARPRAYGVLQHAPDGCRVFMLENLTWEWMLEEPSVLHAVGEGVTLGETELFATSWCTKGYPFYVYYADRTCRPTITSESAISAVHDLYSQGYF